VRAAPAQEDIRRLNLGAVLRHIHVSGALSRADLTARLGLNRATIGALTLALVDAGLVTEGMPDVAGGGRGRPSLVVRPESERVFVLAVAIGVERITVARVGLGGVVLDRRETRTSRNGFTLASAVATVGAFGASLLETAPVSAVYIGTGVAICGIVRGEDGMVRFAPNTGWVDEPLGDRIAEALTERTSATRPVAVGNDADLGALAEHTRGVAASCDDVIYIHGDVGVGGGIITGGVLLAGLDGYGGEIGHMVVRADGRPCGCGSRGCWETEIGEYALLEAAGVAGGGREAVDAVVDAARRGDVSAQEALRQVGDWLGFGIANLVNIFNPQMVVMGGMLRGVYLGAATQVRSRLRTMSLTPHREAVKLRTPGLEEDSPLIGAAELAFGRLLADPLDVGAAWV
jgi:predicted NBD/HSP70 family sugar kinase